MGLHGDDVGGVLHCYLNLILFSKDSGRRKNITKVTSEIKLNSCLIRSVQAAVISKEIN